MPSHTPSIAHPLAKIPKLYPRPPLLSSLTTSWQTIAMGYMHQPAYEFSDVCIPWHGVTILTTPGVTERTLDGISRIDSASPGDIILLPAGISHSARKLSSGEMILIGLAPTLFARAIDDAINFKPTELIPQFATPDPLVYQLGLSLKTALEQNSTGSRLYAETAAAMLSVHLLQYYGQQKLEFKDYTNGLPRSTLHQVIDYIYANLDQELGLSNLAAIANLSPHYFTRLFKQSTGQTPHQFVIRCRVEQAKVLLLNGKGSISDIAQQVGFANQAHLNVHIKRLLGVTPKMILEQRKNR